jgi:hypothetical protein
MMTLSRDRRTFLRGSTMASGSAPDGCSVLHTDGSVGSDTKSQMTFRARIAITALPDPLGSFQRDMAHGLVK